MEKFVISSREGETYIKKLEHVLNDFFFHILQLKQIKVIIANSKLIVTHIILEIIEEKVKLERENCN